MFRRTNSVSRFDGQGGGPVGQERGPAPLGGGGGRGGAGGGHTGRGQGDLITSVKKRNTSNKKLNYMSE